MPPRRRCTAMSARSSTTPRWKRRWIIIGVLTKSYWKPLSPNTIFVTVDNPNKRRDYEEQVAKVFYLSNVNGAQELQEIVNAVR